MPPPSLHSNTFYPDFEPALKTGVLTMTEAALEYGVYSQGHAAPAELQGGPKPLANDAKPGTFIQPSADGRLAPGVCIPWSQKREEMPEVIAEEQLCQSVWENIDALGNMYVWQCLVSF